MVSSSDRQMSAACESSMNDLDMEICYTSIKSLFKREKKILLAMMPSPINTWNSWLGYGLVATT